MAKLQSARIGHFVEWNGSFFTRQEYTLQPTSVEPHRIRAMLDLADSLSRVLHHQTRIDDQMLRRFQYELNELYDDFVATYGSVNTPANQAALGTDPRYFGLMSLEVKTGPVGAKQTSSASALRSLMKHLSGWRIQKRD